MKDLQVLQPYKITMSRHVLTAIEMRIFTTILFKLKNEQLESSTSSHTKIEIDTTELVVNDNWEVVKNAVRKLRSRTIEFEVGNSYVITGIIADGEVDLNTGFTECYINNKLYPHLLDLANGYTKYNLDFAFSTQCQYAIRWYHLANQWLNIGTFKLMIEDIRSLFVLNGKYERIEALKRKVITYPFQEVNKKSNLNIEITETHKQGRRIVSYSFKVSQKQDYDNNSDNIKDNKTLLLDLPKSKKTQSYSDIFNQYNFLECIKKGKKKFLEAWERGKELSKKLKEKNNNYVESSDSNKVLHYISSCYLKDENKRQRAVDSYSHKVDLSILTDDELQGFERYCKKFK